MNRVSSDRDPAAHPAAVDIRWSSLEAAHIGLRSVLDAAERARVDALQRPADRGRSLLGAALLRTVVGERLGVAPEAVRTDRTCDECGEQHGAPRILSEGAPWVSVSHSGLLVAVAVAAAPVGIDVQRVAELEPQQDAAAWVRAEAIAKLEGVVRASGGSAPAAAAHLLAAPMRGYAAALAVPARLGAPLVRAIGP
jgi:4'-phosphopantetheinyl transferase